MNEKGYDIGLCAGHCLQAPGATYGGITEQGFGRVVADRFMVLAQKRGLRVFDPRADLETYSAPPNAISSRTIRARLLKYLTVRPRVVLDLHLNAAAQVLHRQDCIMLYHTGDDAAQSFASALVESVSEALEKRFPHILRFAVSTRMLGRGSLYLTRECSAEGIPAIICEPFFLSEPGVARWLIDTKDETADWLAEAYLNGLIAVFNPVNGLS